MACSAERCRLVEFGQLARTFDFDFVIWPSSDINPKRARFMNFVGVALEVKIAGLRHMTYKAGSQRDPE